MGMTLTGRNVTPTSSGRLDTVTITDITDTTVITGDITATMDTITVTTTSSGPLVISVITTPIVFTLSTTTAIIMATTTISSGLDAKLDLKNYPFLSTLAVTSFARAMTFLEYIYIYTYLNQVAKISVHKLTPIYCMRNSFIVHVFFARSSENIRALKMSRHDLFWIKM